MNAVELEAGAKALSKSRHGGDTDAWEYMTEGSRGLLRGDVKFVNQAIHPTLTMADELDELPLGSVVYGHVFTGSWEKSMADGLWHSPFLDEGLRSWTLLDHVGSVTLLFRGDSK